MAMLDEKEVRKLLATTQIALNQMPPTADDEIWRLRGEIKAYKRVLKE
jgi:surface antigen